VPQQGLGISTVLAAEVFPVGACHLNAGCFVVPDGNGRVKLLQDGNFGATLIIGYAYQVFIPSHPIPSLF